MSWMYYSINLSAASMCQCPAIAEIKSATVFLPGEGDLDLKCIDGKVVTNEVVLRTSSQAKESPSSKTPSRSSPATPTSSSSLTSSPSKSASLPRPSSGLGNFRSVQPPDIRVRSPHREGERQRELDGADRVDSVICQLISFQRKNRY